jgi:hypothetical protein
MTPLDWMEMSDRHAWHGDAALQHRQVVDAYVWYRLAARLSLKGIAELEDTARVARDRFGLNLDLLSEMMAVTGAAVATMTVLFESLPVWTLMDRATCDLVLLRDRPVETLPEWGLL